MTIDLLQQLLARFRRWNHRRATVQALNDLSDWQLRDIGLTRGEIPAIIDAAFEAKEQAPRLHTAPTTRVRVQPHTQLTGVRP